ncbi:MAG TPA: hypothetical protein VF450_24275 [Noviherbaspirillum sp.]
MDIVINTSIIGDLKNGIASILMDAWINRGMLAQYQQARQTEIRDQKSDMFKLTLPPISEMKGIVLDMMPTIQADADDATVRQSVALAETLVALLNCAQENPATEAVLKTILRGIAVRADDIE